jgi:chromosome segregation ATPase
MRYAITSLNMVAALAFALALCGTGNTAAATYKWVDDQGVVHYSDKVPPEAVNKGATVLDKQGRPTKKIEPAPSAEQIKAKAAAEEQQRALAKSLDEQARKDRALMQSYTNEEEIDVARKRALVTIDTQIKSAQVYSADLTRRQEGLKRKKASYGDKPVPIELERDLNTVDVELSRQTALIKQKTDEIAAVNAKYDTDKKRWEEIKSDQQRSSAAAAAMAAQQEAAKASTAPAKK